MYPPTWPPLSRKRVTPLFPSNQTLKVEVFSSLPLSENLVGGSTFQQKGGRGGGVAHYVSCYLVLQSGSCS